MAKVMRQFALGTVPANKARTRYFLADEY